jgi:hypothetical protein
MRWVTYVTLRTDGFTGSVRRHEKGLERGEPVILYFGYYTSMWECESFDIASAFPLRLPC